MPKTYLITLSETDLQNVVYNCVDRAIKINRINPLDSLKPDEKKKDDVKPVRPLEKPVANG